MGPIFFQGIKWHVLNISYMTPKGESISIMNLCPVFQTCPLAEAIQSTFIWWGSASVASSQLAIFYQFPFQNKDLGGRWWREFFCTQHCKACLVVRAWSPCKEYPAAWTSWFKNLYALIQSWFSSTDFRAWARIMLYTRQPPAASDKLRTILASVMPQPYIWRSETRGPGNYLQ